MGNMDSWTGMRKFLEDDMLADSLKGRVRWECIMLPGMDRASAFELYVDETMAKRFSMEMVVCAACGPKKPGEKRDMKQFWEGYWAQKALNMNDRCEFDDEDFTLALAEYRCLGAREAITSDDPVVRLFAILDRHICKNTLSGPVCRMEEQPEWLRPFYQLRMHAEGI